MALCLRHSSSLSSDCAHCQVHYTLMQWHRYNEELPRKSTWELMDYISQSLFGRNEECPEKTLIWGPNSLESLIFVQHSLTAWDPGKTARHIWVSKNADSVTASGLAPVSAATWGCCVWCWGALPCWRPRHIFSAVCLCVCQMKAAFHNATITPWSVWQLCKSTPQPPSGCQAWLHLIPHVWLKAAVTALCKAGRKRSRVWHPLVINQV